MQIKKYIVVRKCAFDLEHLTPKKGREMFDVYMENFKDFKDKYYFVTPLNHTASKSLYNILNEFVNCSDYLSGYFFSPHQTFYPLSSCMDRFLNLWGKIIFIVPIGLHI